jgi:hypothetical protein
MSQIEPTTSASSCPRLLRASTSFFELISKEDVDGRVKPGDDERRTFALERDWS